MPRRPRTRGGLPEWFSQTTQPVFVVDSRRVVLFFNRGCERLTGWSAGDLIGQRAIAATAGAPHEVASVLSALGPPETCDLTSCRVHLLTRDGQSLDRVVHFFPLPPLDAEPVGEPSREPDSLRWLGVISSPEAPLTLSPFPAESVLHAELSALKSDLRRKYGLGQVVAAGSAMQRVLAQLQLAVPSNITLAFCGSPGTGKEHLARAVHYAGEHRVRAFVPVDCRQPIRALETVLEQLISPDREEPPIPVLRRGAVLLQSVEALPLEWQQRLVDEVALSPGQTADSVRWMVTAPEPLDDFVRSGHLLAEFRNRFGVVEVHLADLRERVLEFPLLAQHALEEVNRSQEKQVTGFSPDVWQQFRAYNWPGQLDELFSVVQEAHAACSGPLITPSDLPFRFRTGQDAQSVGPAALSPVEPLEDTLARVEREQIILALEQARGSKSRAADLLGIPRPKLYRRLEALGLASRDSL